MRSRLRKWYRSFVSVLLLCCLVMPQLPQMQPKTAEAATNFIAPQNERGTINNKGHELSRYEFVDGNLLLTNTYNYVAGDRMTYYTVDMVWSKYPSGKRGVPEGYPLATGSDGIDWVLSGVSAYNLNVKHGDTVSKSTYTFYQDNIANMLSTLFGELQPGRPYTIYMSEIFILRHRYADGSFRDYPETLYCNLDDIKAAADWTEKTEDQFEAYYDIPMTFVLTGGRITVVPIDLDNGNEMLYDHIYERQYALGETVKIEPQASLVVDGNTLNYAEKYELSGNPLPYRLKDGYPVAMKFTAPQHLYMFLGYSRSAPPPPVVEDKYNITVIPVDMDNGKKEIPGASFTIEFSRDVEVVIPAEPSYTVSGETLAYSGKWSVDGKSLSNSVNPIKPVFSDFESDHKVYLGYKRGLPIPSPAPVEGTGTIKVVPVDMDNGNTPITSETKVILYKEGDNIHFDIDPTCTKGGEVLSYAEKYNISSSGTNITLSQSGYPRDITMGIPDNKMTLYVGYKRGIAPPVPSITPSITPTPAPIVTAPPLPTLAPVPPTATPSPEESKNTIWAHGQKVQIYADDYDSSTGPYNDLQPYLVNDVSDGTFSSEGSIPSTENVAIRATAKGWGYDVSLKKVEGNMVLSRTVNMPYTYHYTYDTVIENPDYPVADDPAYTWTDDGPVDADGNLVPLTVTITNHVNGSGTFSFDVTATRHYSLWVVDYVDTYRAAKFEVTNGAFPSMVTIPVDWGAAGAPNVPEPQVSKSRDVSVPPIPAVTHGNSHFESSDFNWMFEVCKTFAMNNYSSTIPELTVRSDSLTIDGVVILDGSSRVGNAYGPNNSAYGIIESRIKDISFNQAYKSGIDLIDTKYNALYQSDARVTYVNQDGTKTRVPDASEMQVNDIKVHTPVVCDGVITVDGVEQAKHDSGDFGYGATVDLPLRSEFNPFTIEISNEGTHKIVMGYGERDFEKAKSGASNMAITAGEPYNEVIFPFGVYYDVNGDSFDADGNLVSFADDRYFEPNTPLGIGTSTAQFYVHGSLQPNVYDITFRSVAVNCPKKADGSYDIAGYSQKNANINTTKYAATDLIKLNVYEDFMDFRINGTNDPVALKALNNGQYMLTLDKGYYFNFIAETIGEKFNSNTMGVTFKPTYTFISENGKSRVDADLYYHENIKGKSEYYVEVGGAKDATNIHTYTNRDELPGINKNVLGYTEYVLGREIAGNKTEMFTFGGNILSNQWFRMHHAITEPMPNMYCPNCLKVYSETQSRPCSCVGSPVTIFTMPDAEKLAQSWYAGFYIPADTFCVTADTKQGYCDACQKIRYVFGGRTSCPDHGTPLKVSAGGAAGVSAFNFNAYASEHTLSGEEEFFRKDGYIAITFAIEAKDSASSFHRVYEEYDKTEIAKQWMASGFPYQTGDVILYRLDKSIRDAYEIGGSE